MPTTGKTFVDTNVLVYTVDEAEPAKRSRARDVLAALSPGDFVVSTQVLAEFYVVVTRKLAMREADAAAALEELSRLRVVPLEARLVEEGIALSRRASISLWDALIVRAAAEAGCDRLLSEDLADASRMGGVSIENPFRDLSA
ncbi:MAG: PIN domain-containing protein [Actinomycetota bacterium]